MSYVPKNIIVTGGCGFIGSNFLNYIFHKWTDSNFVNIDKLILNSNAFYVDEDVRNSPRYQLVTCDIKNRSAVLHTLNEHQIDTIIHFGADCTSTRCYSDPVESLENNTIAFVEFLDAVYTYGQVKRFIHISTDEVYGDSELNEDEKGKVEEDLLLPGNPYAATKAAGESFVHLYAYQYGLPIIILRINNIYGPNQWDVKVVPRYIDLAIKKEKFRVQGTGKQMRSWLYTEDASEGIRMATEKGKIGEIYNLGTYFELNVLDVARVVQAEVDKQLGREPTVVEYEFIPDRPYNDMRYLLDISKANKELGWTPRVSFDDGISKVIAHTLSKKPDGYRMKVIIFGGNGWIGQCIQKMLLDNKIAFSVAKTFVGRNTDEEVKNEILELCGTHVLCCTGRTHGGKFKTIEYLEGGADKAYENIRDNLYCVVTLAQICSKLGLHYTYIGTAYLFSYDADHPIGGKTFMDDDAPTFFGNSYSVVKGFADRMAKQFSGGIKESINARITLPLTFNVTDERNLLTKILTYKQIFNIPVSITILDDCMPIVFDLMEKRFGGNLNLVNPGPISLHEIVDLYKMIVNPNHPDYELVDKDTEKGKEILRSKGNCALDTTLLEKSSSAVFEAKESLKRGFERMVQVNNLK